MNHRRPSGASRVRGRIALALALALALGVVACGSDEERVEASLARFSDALASNDMTAALSAVNEIAAALPDSPDSSYKLAHLLIRMGEHNRALWLLEAAIERFPDDVDLRVTLADVSIRVGDAKRALTALEPVPVDVPQAASATLLRAKAQRELGDAAASLASLAAAEDAFEQWTEFRVARVTALVEDGRLDEALALARDARAREGLAPERDPWFAELEANLLANELKTDEALRILAELTQANPEERGPWDRRAEILLQQGRLEEWCDELRAALELRPDIGFLYELLAFAESGRGNSDEAEAVLRKRMERMADVASVVRLANFLVDDRRIADALEVLESQRGRFEAAESTELDYLEIVFLLESGDRAAAHERYEDFRRRHGSDPLTEYLHARLDLADGDAASAAERLNKLLPRLSRADVQHWYGVALQGIGDYEGAEYRFGLAIMQDARQLASHVKLLWLLERRGAWADVRDAARMMLKMFPANELGAVTLSRAQIRLGVPEEAEQTLRDRISRFPNLAGPETVVGLAAALRAQGRLAEALAVLDAEAERFGAKVAWRGERALLLAQLGRGEEALEELDHPDSEDLPAVLHRVRAMVLFMSGRGGEAIAEVERAVELDPTQPEPLRLLGDYHAQRGELSSAVAAYRRYLAERPLDAEGHFRLGAALDSAGETRAAIAAYRRAVEIDDDLVAPRNNLALALDTAGRRDEALVVAQETYALANGNPMVLDTLGWLYLRSDRGQRGVILLERAHAMVPEDPSVTYHLAIGLGETGRAEESRVLLQELSAQLAPGHALRGPVAEAVAALESSDAS